MDIQQLIGFDQELLLNLNGSDSLFWDGCMLVYTSMAVWMPLALVLLYVLLKGHVIGFIFSLLFWVFLLLCRY